MMDRNREARRAAAMANGLQRRRLRTTTGSLRDSPEDDGPMELQETARLRDRTAKKDRDREIRDRDRDRDRERDRDRDRDRLNRNKRRRGVEKYLHGSNRDDGGANGGDDSSEESVNDEDEEDDDGVVRYAPPSNPVSMTSTSIASNLSHRKSYPPPSKIFRSAPVAPSWKTPDEMIGFSIPRKARSASTKRSHECWSSGGGDQIHQSPVRSSMTTVPPLQQPMSPSSSNVSIKKKIKPNGPKHKVPPKPCPKSSPSVQEEIEIEVAEVLFGLMKQSHVPSPANDSVKVDRSTVDSKSRASSPISAPPQNSASQAPPLTTVAPKRKRPRPYPEESSAVRSNPISPVVKAEVDQTPKPEPPPSSTLLKAIPESALENGELTLSNDELTATPSLEAGKLEIVATNGVVAEVEQTMEESGSKDGVGRAKVEKPSLLPNLESQDHNHNRVEAVSISVSTSSSAKAISAPAEKNHREDMLEIDLMALPPQSRGSPEREGEAEDGDGGVVDEKSMVTDREAEAKPKKEEDLKEEKSSSSSRGVELNVNAVQAEADAEVKALTLEGGPHREQPLSHLNLNSKNRNIDLEKADRATAGVNPQQQPTPPPLLLLKSEPNDDSKPSNGQSSSVPLAMSVAAGWQGVGPVGYVAPLQGVVSMDGTALSPAPIQPSHFVFCQLRSKRCATHCNIAKSIVAHQQLMKINPFWPAAAAGSAPVFGSKPYNLNLVPPPADLHAAAAAARAAVVCSTQDKAQPFTFFPGHPLSKDKPPQITNAPDSSQKKQFVHPQSLPTGTPANVLHAPAFFFPFGQQQATARPSTAKSPSTAGSAISVTPTSPAPMGAASTVPAAAGPAMNFNYPNIGGNETQFMAILGNSPYPFPITAPVGAATPYRGSHPQAMSFFNGSFYSSQMLHPSQLQQQQSGVPSQSLQIQPQNHQNPSISTSSSSQKHLQNQQQRPLGSGASAAGASNSNLQNFQGGKGRPSQPLNEVGGEESPSTADSRARQNLSVYGPNFTMPFNSPNFALMTAPPTMLAGGSNATGVPNGNHSDKKQQQQQQQHHSQHTAFPMSFASVKGASSPGFDVSSMAHNHGFLQSYPDAARHSYQLMAAAAQAAQAANQKKNSYPDGKSGAGIAVDSSNAEEDRKVMASRASMVSAGQSIPFSRDLADSSVSTIAGNNVVDSSARSVGLAQGSARHARSSGHNTLTNSSTCSAQQQQMIFPKQQQFAASSVATSRSKTPATSNGSVYPDHLTSPSAMAAKFQNALPCFPPLVQSSVPPSHSSQWKTSVRPNTSQVSSPSIATSTATATSTIKNLPLQQSRPQPNLTQISFAPASSNPKPSMTSQNPHTPNSNQAPSPPRMVGSPSNSSVSKGGSTRTTTSTSTGNKTGPQAATLSTQQGRNSPSPSLSSQKPSILGSPHVMSSTSSTSKPQLQESQQQPQLSKQSIQQAQLFFSNAYMQPSSVNPATAGGYYLHRHRPDQQQPQGSKPQGSGPSTSSSGMLSLSTPVSFANASTSDPTKAVAAVAAAAAAANRMKGGLSSQGMLHAAQFAAAQPAGGAHQLVPAGFPYVHAVPATVQVKTAEQKQPAGE